MKKRLHVEKIRNIFGNYWIVRNKKKEFLGTFNYDICWKKMVWKQAEDIQMSSDCLRELADSMDNRRSK